MPIREQYCRRSGSIDGRAPYGAAEVEPGGRRRSYSSSQILIIVFGTYSGALENDRMRPDTLLCWYRWAATQERQVLAPWWDFLRKVGRTSGFGRNSVDNNVVCQRP